MKFFATTLTLCAILAIVYAGNYGIGSATGGSASPFPAPICPKNYLFSCQPNLAPVPCASPATSFGTVGAYSENIPIIVTAPPYAYQGLPQQINEYPNYYGRSFSGY